MEVGNLAVVAFVLRTTTKKSTFSGKNASPENILATPMHSLNRIQRSSNQVSEFQPEFLDFIANDKWPKFTQPQSIGLSLALAAMLKS